MRIIVAGKMTVQEKGVPGSILIFMHHFQYMGGCQN